MTQKRLKKIHLVYKTLTNPFFTVVIMHKKSRDRKKHYTTKVCRECEIEILRELTKQQKPITTKILNEIRLKAMYHIHHLANDKTYIRNGCKHIPNTNILKSPQEFTLLGNND